MTVQIDNRQETKYFDVSSPANKTGQIFDLIIKYQL